MTTLIEKLETGESARWNNETDVSQQAITELKRQAKEIDGAMDALRASLDTSQSHACTWPGCKSEAEKPHLIDGVATVLGPHRFAIVAENGLENGKYVMRPARECNTYWMAPVQDTSELAAPPEGELNAACLDAGRSKDGNSYVFIYADGAWNQTSILFATVTTAPPARAWTGLTEDEAHVCFKSANVWHAIEAKLKEKNHGG